MIDELHDAFLAHQVPVLLPKDARARAVAERLLDDPSIDWDLPRWGREVGASERTLRRLFHSGTGQTFVQWRTRVRVHAALDLLEAGRPIADVVARSGYLSTDALARAVKSEVGLTLTDLADRESPSTLRPAQWPKPSSDWPTPPRSAREDALTDLVKALRDGGDMVGNGWRGSLIGAAAVLLLAACGDGDTDSSEAVTTGVENDGAETAETAETSSEPSGPIIVTDAAGRSVTLEAPPERIMVTTLRYVPDELMLLGIDPLGYASDPAEELNPWQIAEMDEQGFSMENFAYPLNYEEIAGGAPDLIVAMDYEVDAIADLEQIAPVLVVEYGVDLSGDRLRLLGAVTGRSEVADEIVDGALDQLLGAVSAPDSEISVIFGYEFEGTNASVYPGGVDVANDVDHLEAAGFNVKSDYSFEAGDFGYTDVAEENFGELEADWLWNLAPYPGNADADEAALLDSPVFTGLDVWQRGDGRLLDRPTSQAILFWTPLATDFLADRLDDLVASYDVG
ncbi:MAG: helix-turn-helix domain-containing protein [Actinomycetota bacterium]